MKILYLLLLVFASQIVQAQENPFSQQNAEMKALKKYEQEHPASRLLSGSMPEPASGDNERYFGARLVRSATLLASSCPERRWPVKILVYGQSITGSQIFTEQLSALLKNNFPYADITLENRAIGGFGAEQIIRTAVHDVYPFYPDLIIFHVYGGESHGELEQLFTNIRKYTTSDILLLNHHLDGNKTQVNQTSYQYLRYIANKYNCELADVSTEWTQYVRDNNLKTSDLLRDSVHPNRNGNWLLAQIIGKHLKCNMIYPSQWTTMVQTCFINSAYDNNSTNPLVFKGLPWRIINNIPTGENDKSTLKLTFYGNKVDVISGQPTDSIKTGTARILLDGQPVSEKNMVYSITRPSPGPGSWFPAIRRISYKGMLVAENWTLTIDKVNADSTIWYFSVSGSKTGKDGSGNSGESFISKSGRVLIDQTDFMFAEIKKSFHTAAPIGFVVHWSVVPLFQSIYYCPTITDRTKTYKSTLLQGLKNGPHTLELIPVGDGPVPVEAFEIHRPPLE